MGCNGRAGRGNADTVRLRVIAAALTLFAAGLLASCGASSGTGSESNGTSTSGLATAACETRLITTACHSTEEWPP
jgi:hypothetical protein